MAADRQKQAEQAKKEQEAAVMSMTKKIEKTVQQAEQEFPSVIATTIEEGRTGSKYPADGSPSPY